MAQRSLGAAVGMVVEQLECRTLLSVAAGNLDAANFGMGGKVITDFSGAEDNGNAVAVVTNNPLANGDIAVAGVSNGDFAVALYNPAGTLVAAAITAIDGGFSQANAVTIDSSGNIVAAGYTNNAVSNNDIAIARYKIVSSGGGLAVQLDSSFGTGGIVTTDVNSARKADEANAVAIDGRGNIIVAGQTGNHALIASYSNIGALNWTTVSPGNDVGNALAVESGGSILVVGHNGTHAESLLVSAGGAITNTTTLNLGNADNLTSIAAGPNGEYIVAGTANSDFVVAEIVANGTLDTSFGTGGETTTSFTGSTSAQANGVAISDVNGNENEKIYLAGMETDSSSGADFFAVARYNANGSLDSAFGTAGTATTDFTVSGATANSTGAGVAIQADGLLVVAGTTNASASGTGAMLDNLAVARYVTNNAPTVANSAASLDPIAENDSSSAGTTVATLVSRFGMTDPDGDVVGLAITGVENTYGTWQYLPAGGSWTNIPGTVSDTAALLLPPTATIRFQPTTGSTGSSTITVRAWDQTKGTSYTVANVTTNGLANYNSFSDNPYTASIAVNAPSPLNTVFVDASWAGSTPGQNVSDGFGQHIFGTDAFATIQAGVNAVSSGGTVNVDAGTYVANGDTAVTGVAVGATGQLHGTEVALLNIDKPVSIIGPNTTFTPTSASSTPANAQAVIVPGVSDSNPYDASAVIVVLVSSSNVTIQGVTVDGINSALGSHHYSDPGTPSFGPVNPHSGFVTANSPNAIDASEDIASYANVGGISIENDLVENAGFIGVDFNNGTDYGGSTTYGNTISSNLIQNISDAYGYGDGINLYDNFYAAVNDNVIHNVYAGVQIGNFSQADSLRDSPSISGNQINAGGVGIFYNSSYDFSTPFAVTDNTVTAVNNLTYTAGWTGVLDATSNTSLNVDFNDNVIDGSGANALTPTTGYEVWSSTGTEITGGTVSGVQTGVLVTNVDPNFGGSVISSAVDVSNVSISASGDGVVVDDIPLTETSTLFYGASTNVVEGDASATLSGDSITAGNDGVLVESQATSAFTASATIQNNTEISGAATGAATGIEVTGSSATATISNNHIYHNTTGIEFTAGGSGSVSGNNFAGSTDNGTDLFLDSTAGAVTIGDGNSFAGATNYIDNTSSQGFNLSGYITTTFGGFNAATTLVGAGNLNTFFGIEDKIVDYLDNPAYGYVRITPGYDFVTQLSESTTPDAIQRGVNVANSNDISNDTVEVQSGTFVGQVLITKNLTLLGQSESGVVVQANAGLSSAFSTGSGDKFPVIFAGGGATVTVQNLTVDGNAQGNNYADGFEGIAFYNAGGAVHNVTVENVENSPFNGVQDGVAVYADNADGTNRSLTITGDTINNYQKNGTALFGNGLTVDVENDTVTGAGSTSQIAQNGIEVALGASGTISNNTVSGNEYSGSSGGPDQFTDTQSCGILLYATSGLQVSGNIVDGNDIGIYNNTDGAVISNNQLGNTTANRYYGIMEDQGSATISGNTIRGGAVGLDVVTFDGQTGEAASAIITGNTVSGAGIGLEAVKQSAADPAVNVLAQTNTLIGNGEGVLISGGAKVDLGYDSSDTIPGHAGFTGLGTSTGHNILTGYLGGAGHYAIDDQNTPQGTEPDVLAEDNNFGPYTATDPAGIGAVINDHHNNSSLTTVFYLPALNPLPAPETVYVNIAWVGSSFGSDPGALGGGHSFGYDEFGDIQSAINAVASGGNVIIDNGTYDPSNILVNKPVTIQGQTQAGVIITPSLIDSHDDSSFGGTASNGFIIASSGVTIETLTIDGGAGQNFRDGIITNSANDGNTYGHITIQHVTVENVFRKGIAIYNYTGIATGDVIENNTLTNIGATNSDASAYEASGAIAVFGSNALIENNNITASAGGILSNTFDGSAELLTITGNSISSPVTALANGALGIDVASLATGSTVSGNTVDLSGGNGNDIGIVVSYDRGAVTVGNDTVTGKGGDDGILLYQDATSVAVSGNTIQTSAADSGAGILVTAQSGDISRFGASPASVFASITGNTITAGFADGIKVVSAGGIIASAYIGDGTTPGANSITGATVGVLVTGSIGTASISDNSITNSTVAGIEITSAGIITGNTIDGASGGTGVLVTGASASVTVSGNNIYGNAIGLNFTGGGSGSADDNNFAGTASNGTDIFIDSTSTSVEIGDGNAFAATTNYIDNESNQPFVLSGYTTTTFDEFNAATTAVTGGNLSTFYGIEDKIVDYLDKPSSGYISIKDGYVFVTQKSENTTPDAIERGVSVANPGDLVDVQTGSYVGDVAIGTSLTLNGTGSPNLTAPSSASNAAIISVAAANVTVEGFDITVDQPHAAAGIAAVSAASGPNLFDGLQILNNVITTTGSGGALNTPYGTTYSIGIAALANGGGTAPTITISGNTVLSNAPSYLKRALWVNEVQGTVGGATEVAGNTLTGTYEDALIAFSRGATTVENNAFDGVGVTITEPNAGAPITISNNTFDSSFGGVDDASLEIKHNYNLSSPVSILDNNFTVSSNSIGILSAASIGVSVTGNSFAPAAGAVNTVDVDMDTMIPSGSQPAAATLFPNSISITGNMFNAGSSASATAIQIANHDAGAITPDFGAITIGGAGLLANTFDKNLANFIVEAPPTSSVSFSGDNYSGAEVTAGNVPVNIDATGNNFGVSSGDGPGSYTLADYFAIEDKIVDAIDYGGSGLVRINAGNVYVTPNSFISPASTTPSIQRGVNAASTNDTVNVEAGTYSGDVNVNKTLTLKGAQAGVAAPTRSGPESIIQSPDGTTELEVSASNVTVDGFTVQGNTNANVFGPGVFMTHGISGTQFNNNIVQKNIIGLDLVNDSATDQAVISGNLFQNNTNPGAASGNDIYADQYTAGVGGVQDVLITNNSFTNSSFDENSSGVGISNAGNTPFSNIAVTDNTFSNAGGGMYFENSTGVTITANNVSGATYYAVGLFGTTDTNFNIGQNTLNGNGDGIDLYDDVTGLNIHNNFIQNNSGDGIYVDSSVTVSTGDIAANINSISGNTTAGLENDSAVTVDASQNWWGSASGPTTPLNTFASTGTGDTVIGTHVIIAPWLPDGVDSQPAVAGFQHGTVTTATPVVGIPVLTASSDTGFSNSDRITNDKTPSFTGTFSVSVGGVTPTVAIYDGSTLLGDAVVTGSGTSWAWSFTTLSSLSDGVHSITAQATDSAGNSATSGPLSITIDTQNPVVGTPVLTTDSGFSPSDDITNVNEPSFSGVLTVENGAQTPQVVIKDGSTVLGSAIVTGSGTSWSWTFTTTSALTDGSHSITAVATDVAGNVGTSSALTITIDTVNPVVGTPVLTTDSGFSNSDDITNVNKPGFSGVLTVEDGTQTPHVVIKDGSTVLGSATVTGSGTSWSWTFTAPSALTDGSHSITAVATDVAGDVGTSNALAITIDTQNPVPTINGSSAATGTGFEGTPISLTGLPTDPAPSSGIHSYDWHVVASNGQVIADGSSPNNFSFTPENSGTYSVTYTVTDNAGNVGTATDAITVANTAPSDLSLTPTPGTINEDATTVLSGSFVDPGTLKTHTVVINWGDGSPNTTLPLAAGILSFTAPAHAYQNNISANTNYTIGVTVTDSNGGSTSNTTSVTVDYVAPTVTLMGSQSDNTNPTPNDAEGSTFTLTLDPVNDPGYAGGNRVEDYFINWGDGSAIQEISAASLPETSGGTVTHVYEDGIVPQGTTTPTENIQVDILDGNGYHAAAGSLGIVVYNVPPTASFSGSSSVAEGSSANVVFFNQSDPSPVDTAAGFTYSYDFNDSGTFEITGSSSPNATVPASFLSTPGVVTVRGRITDKDGGYTDYTHNITVTNVAPTVNPLSNITNATTGTPISEGGSFTDPGSDSPWLVYVNYDETNHPGLGTLVQSGASKSFTLGTTYNTPGLYTVQVTVEDLNGGAGSLSGTGTFTVNVALSTFHVTHFNPTSTGFDVEFNRAANLTVLNLYSGLGGIYGAPDLTLVGPNGPVTGSLVWNATTDTADFIQTGAVLAPGSYTATLVSGANSFEDTSGNLLQSNDPSGNYVAQFSVGAAGDVLSVPDFARGPGQPVNLPATSSAGIPITLSDGTGVTAVDFDLTYNPALLTITGLNPGPNFPGSGWSITTNNTVPGELQVSVSGTSALPSGKNVLLDLVASVPLSATYGASDELDVTNLVINGGFIAGTGFQAVGKVAFIGDAAGIGSYDPFSAYLISNVVVHNASGFDAYPLTDPVIIADVVGTGTLSGQDASDVAQASIGLTVPQIPAIPGGFTPSGPIPRGTDPHVSIPANVQGFAGQNVNVPLNIDDATLVDSGKFALTYDPTVLTLNGISAGTLDASGWFFNFNPANGQVAFFNTGNTPPPAGAGSIASVQFAVAPTASLGTVTPVGFTTGSNLNAGGLPLTTTGGNVDVGIQWVGLGDNINWNDPNNWSDVAVPTQNDVVYIHPGVPVVQIAGGAYAVGGLTSFSPIEVTGTGSLQLFGETTITSPLTIDNGGTLDIQDNILTINYGSLANDESATIRGYLKSAYDGGIWNGAGLTSSAVEAQVAAVIAAKSGGVWGIGYADGGKDANQTVAVGNQLVIEPALIGDANLNGTVNFIDLGIVAQNLGSSAGDWEHGDFNYDGTTNFLDIGLVAQNLNISILNTPLAARVPAPAAAVVTTNLTVAAPVTPAAKKPAPAAAINLVAADDAVVGVWTAPSSSGSSLFAEGSLKDVLD